MSNPASPAPALLLPPVRLYPEREIPPEKRLDRAAAIVSSAVIARFPKLFTGRLHRMVSMARRLEESFANMDDQELRQSASDLRDELRQSNLADAAVARAFALVREAAARTIGQRHYDVQLIGGFAILKGMVAEMETGEGKTLAATLPACTAALAGIPVHVITVNDYLVGRDAELMGPIYRALGLTVGTVVHGMDPNQRRAAYRCDVTYCTNKEIAFDYLRDRMVLGEKSRDIRLKLERLCGEGSRADRLVMRGLKFAIVDEADSVLIDEARTPLIISGETDAADEQRQAEEALQLIEPLESGTDFQVLSDERLIELTERGRGKIEEQARQLDLDWMGRVRREEAARQALTALHLFHRDEHYLVRDGKVEIIDEYTGRIMADRSWSEGLHQLIEVKEGCEATGRKVPLARMTYQRFFRRYQHLSGMTGTARETAGELWSVYRLSVARIPTHRPARRSRLSEGVCGTTDSKWRRIARRVSEMQDHGQPVLVGTRSVGASQEASEYLTAAGVEHVVLNAAQDEDEAEIIALAGQRGRVTVATNMAGRGVDIKLGEDVEILGGLHIVMSERHDARRIDRQLLGRCGRQGEPGSTEVVLSLQDPLLNQYGGKVLARLAQVPGWIGKVATGFLFDRAQLKAERIHSRARRDLLKYDQRLNTLLSFSGRLE